MKAAQLAVRQAATVGVLLALAAPTAAAPVEHLSEAAFRRHPQVGHVTSLAQDTAGFLWVGTIDGLYRYDGFEFRPMTIPAWGRIVSALAAGPDGRLWIGTRGHPQAGLAVVAGADVRALPDATAGEAADVLALLVRGADVWIGTSRGLYRHPVDGTRGRRVDVAGLAEASVTALAADGDTVWIGTDRGLFRHAGTTFELVVAAANLPGHVSALAVGDPEGLVFAVQEGLVRAQLFRLEAGRPVPFGPDAGALPRPPIKLIDVPGRGLWLGTANGPYRHTDGGHHMVHVEPVGLPPDMRIEAMLVDRRGTLWLGTEWEGLLALSAAPPVRVWREPRGVRDGTTFAVTVDAAGTLWTTLGDALWRRTGDRFDLITPPADLQTFSLRSLAATPDGTLWVSNLAHGVYSLEGERWKLWRRADGLPDQPVLSVFVDGKGTLWLAPAGGGLVVRERDAFRAVPGAREACPATIVAMAESNGTRWFATDGAGLCEHDGRAFRRISTKDGLPPQLTALLADREGTLWVGTADAGLAVYRGGRATSVPRLPELGVRHVAGVMEDDGAVWLATWNGLYRFGKAQLLALADGRVRTDEQLTYLHLDTSDGLPASAFMSRFPPAAARDRDGSLWFACHRALVEVPRSARAATARLPGLVVESVLVNGQPAAGAPITLPVGNGALEVHYTVPELEHARRMRFSYRLAGFDRAFHHVGARRHASYTNLPAGTYELVIEARASDRDEVERATVPIVLLAPFHRTRTFYAVCVAGLAALLLGLHRLRVLRVRARFDAVVDERARIARDMHDTLEQSLIGMKLQLENMRDDVRDPARLSSHIERASELVAQSMRDARSSIWALRSGRADHVDLATALSVVAGYALRGSEIRFQLTTEGEPYRLEPEAEQQIVRIVQEAITNALKHARPNSIEGKLVYRDDGLLVSLRDDGAGFDPSSREAAAATAAGHFGLAGMRERAAQLAAAVSVESRPGEGTRIELSVPARWRRRTGTKARKRREGT